MTHAPFQGVVTPEAVVLEFEPAGVGSRGAAALIDFTIRFMAFYLALTAGAFFAGFAGSAVPGWVFVTLLTIVTFLLLFAYPIIFEAMWDGRTPGKAVFGLRVVTTDGSPINFRHAALRGMLGFFELLMTSGAVAVISSFVSRRGQRVGDMVAGTLVLRERNAMAVPRAVSFPPPPGAEFFVETLDVGRMSADDYGNVRSFLLRSRSFQTQARRELAEQLAARYVESLNVSPPAEMPAETFLICLASAYQRRFAGPLPLL